MNPIPHPSKTYPGMINHDDIPGQHGPISGARAVSGDGRPLHVRVKALANRFDAMAIGAEKRAALSAQVAENHRRDAATLHEAASFLDTYRQDRQEL